MKRFFTTTLLGSSIPVAFSITILFLLIQSNAVSQPQLTRVETAENGTGDSYLISSVAELNGKAYYLNGSKIIEVDENLNTREITPTLSGGSATTMYYIATLGDKLFVDRFYKSGLGGEPSLVDPSDGSTTIIKDVHPGSRYVNVYSAFSTGDKVFFLADDGSSYGLWVTDGTESGTIKLADTGYSAAQNTKYFKHGDKVIVSLNNNSIWASDGTVDGTEKIITGNVYSYYMEGTTTDDYFYFSLRGPNVYYQVYRSDGTLAGTEQIFQNPAYNQISTVFSIGNDVFFTGYSYDTYTTKIYRFNGTNSAATEIAELPSSISTSGSNGSVAYFLLNTSPYTIWKTNGTNAGTTELGTLGYNDYYTGAKKGFAGDNFVLSIYTPDTGVELWGTDGTVAGTGLLKDIEPGPFSSLSSTPFIFEIEAFDKILFSAKTTKYGSEPWISDGTSAGTTLMEDVNSNPQTLAMFQILTTGEKIYTQTSSSSTAPSFFEINENQLKNALVDGNTAYLAYSAVTEFNKDFYFYGSAVNSDEYFYQGLTRRDETGKIEAVKKTINLYSYGLNVVNNKLFFSGYSSGQGYELWVSEDGTDEGTHQVKNIAPGGNSSMRTSNSTPISIVFFNGKYYFSANDNVNGYELWVTDLTEEGTQLFYNLDGSSSSSEPKNFFVANGKLYFTAYTNGANQVWVTDGTTENTEVLATANGDQFFQVGDEVYFLDNYSSWYYKLWKSDGTGSGTQEVRDLGYSYYSLPAIKFDGGLLYCADNGPSYDYYLIDNDGTETKFKGNTSQIRGLTSWEKYVYYIVGSSMRVTNGSDIDLEVINLYSASYLSANNNNAKYTRFGQDLFFYMYENQTSTYALWKLNLFKQSIALTYNASPLASGGEIDFGSITYTSESGAKTISITNNGFVDWKFPEGSSIEVKGEAEKDFIITSSAPPSVLRPGESFDVVVKFNPQNGGIREAYFELMSSDESSSTTTVKLTGKGTNFPQNINFLFASDIPFREGPYELAAYASSRLPLTYTSTDNEIATFTSEGFVTKKFGTVTIKASQPGNEYFLAAAPVQKEVNITIGNQSIGLSIPTTYTFGDAPVQLSGTTSSGNPINAFTSGNTALMTIDGTTATLLGAGTVTVTATVDGNAFFNAGEQTFTFTVNKAAQAISFAPLEQAAFGSTVELTATGGASGQPVVFTSLDPTVATIAGNTVTILKPGTVMIQASQAESTNYSAAPSVSQKLTVVKATQTLSFEAPASKTFGDGTFELAASATSGLPVSFTSSDNATASIEGNVVTIHRAGTVTLKASQSGNANYNSSTSVEQPLVIAKASQSITFGELAAATVGDEPLTLSGEASSGLAVVYVSSNTEVAIVEGNSLIIVGDGEATITASQGGNVNYSAAEEISQPLVVAPAVLSAADEDLITSQVYPNPSDNILHVALPGNISRANYRLTQLSGQVVKFGELTSDPSRSQIVMADLGPGVYLLTVSAPNYAKVFRVIKN